MGCGIPKKTWKSSRISSKIQHQRQTLEIVEDFACEAKNLRNLRKFRIFSFFYFLHFLHFSFFSFLFIFQSSEQTPKPRKNRRTVPVVKMTICFCEISIFGPRWTREKLRKEGGPAFMVFHFFFFPFCFLLRKMFLLIFLSKKLHCLHSYHSLTIDVSSAVGAPWRCGLLTT